MIRQPISFRDCGGPFTPFISTVWHSIAIFSFTRTHDESLSLKGAEKINRHFTFLYLNNSNVKEEFKKIYKIILCKN